MGIRALLQPLCPDIPFVAASLQLLPQRLGQRRVLRQGLPLQPSKVSVNAIGDPGCDLCPVRIRRHCLVLGRVGHKAHFHDGDRDLAVIDAGHGVRLPERPLVLRLVKRCAKPLEHAVGQGAAFFI